MATKLAIDEIDEVIYTHIDDQHPDTMRFVKDCEEWFGKPITVLQSRYRTVAACWRASGLRRPTTPQGSPCTKWLKKRVRKEWEAEHEGVKLRYVWGMDAKEEMRCERLRGAMPQQEHSFPLVEEKKAKQEAHEILRASGVKRPVPYDLGFHNNNCMGCLRGGRGYFNLIRKVWPEVFAERAALERERGGTILKDAEGNPVWLDELDPEAGRHEGPICDDCGIMCELMALPGAQQ